MKKAQVRKTSSFASLTEFAKEKKIKMQDIKLLYDFIHNRNVYLDNIYELSIKPAELHITDEPLLKSHWNNNSKNKYKNIIRNMHFYDIFQNTQSGFNIPPFLTVLLELFLEGIVYYKFFTPSALRELREGSNSFISSSFFRISSHASIMNPYLVYSINETALNAKRVFSPTLGWSSYCYGFLESPNVVEYVGTDVIPRVCQKTEEFAKHFYPTKNTRIFCKPSEKLLYDDIFMKKYSNHFDTIFFSPPYYELEIYPGNKQSTIIYKSYAEWLSGYWRPTVELCYRVLKRGGKMCYILSNYGSVSTKEYDLMRDMGIIVREKFAPFRKYRLSSNIKMGETVFIFLKD